MSGEDEEEQRREKGDRDCNGRKLKVHGLGGVRGGKGAEKSTLEDQAVAGVAQGPAGDKGEAGVFSGADVGHVGAHLFGRRAQDRHEVFLRDAVDEGGPVRSGDVGPQSGGKWALPIAQNGQALEDPTARGVVPREHQVPQLTGIGTATVVARGVGQDLPFGGPSSSRLPDLPANGAHGHVHAQVGDLYPDRRVPRPGRQG